MSPRRSDTMGSASLKLLLMGAGFSVPASLVAIGIIWGVVSAHAGLSCAVGAGAGLIAMGLSQGILTGAARLSPQATLVVAMVAFGIAMAGIMALLAWIKSSESFTISWTAIGIVVAASSYLVGAAIAHPRLRLLYYSSTEDKTHDDHENL